MTNIESDQASWRASEDVVCSPVGNEIALLDFGTDTYFTLNGSGAFVWTLLEAPRSVPELCAAVAARYEIGEDDCRDDVTSLVTTLHERGLIRRADADARA